MDERAYAPANPLLVGRQRELELLWRQLQAAADGALRVALIAGEPGIGKTRLLDTVAQRAGREGIAVLRGGASEAEGMPPYLPFLDALGQHIRSTDAALLREQAGAAAPTLAALLPELGERLGALPSGYPLPPDQARLRLYEAIGAFLAAIAAPSSLVLLLDDLQWADAATLDVLCHIVRHQPAARLLIIGAYREGEVAHHSAFQRAVAELNRLRALTTIAAGPLSEAEIGALAAACLGAPVAAPLGRLLFTQSEGNPFFAEELLRGWMETGALGLDEGFRRGDLYWTPAASIETALPSSIVGAVRQRLARLAPEVVELLRGAAIIGRTFDAALLAEVAGQELDAVEDRLVDASRVLLIHSNPTGTFTFSHDKIRECLYAEVTATRRRRLHGFIGQALEAHPESAQQLAELAFHFTRSGDRARGATYARRAAEQALGAYAPETALPHFRAALDLLDADDERRGELLFGLGEAATLAGAEEEAVVAFDTARAWFAQAGDSRAAGRAAQRLGRAWWRQEAIPAARAAFETALAALADHPCADTVEALVDLGTLLAVNLHQQANGIAYGRRALEMARRLEDDRLIAAASRAVGNLLVRANNLEAGIPLLEHALALATAADEPAEGAECCASLAMAYFWAGQMHRSEACTRARMEFAQRCHDPFQLRHIYLLLAAIQSMQGRGPEAEQTIAQARPIVERLSSPEPLAYFNFIRGMMAYGQGEYVAAEELLMQALEIFRAVGPGALVWYLSALGVVQLAQGKRMAALACMAEVESLLATLPPGSMPVANLLAYLTVMALALDDGERLAHYYPQLVPFSGQFHDYLIDRLLGEIATRLGEWDAARAYLTPAAATARQENLAFELARTLEAQADLELAQGGRGRMIRASDLLEEALAMYQSLGNPSEERRLRERRRGLARRTGEPRQPTLPAGLSAREAEVLRLVAAGKSNREIAQVLILSEKTVANHLTNIFTKTGADNRTAAAAFAIRHGLA